MLQPVYGGGIPPQHVELEITMEFREGGAFDFSTTFDRLKERLKQAVDVARESGLTTGDGTDVGDGRGGGALAGVNLNTVHLEDLPAYEESQRDTVVSPTDGMPSPAMGSSGVPGASSPPLVETASPVVSPEPQQEPFQPPSEPPPGYEEVQRGSIADELERMVRRNEE